MDDNVKECVEVDPKKCLASNEKIKCPPGRDAARYMVNCVRKGDRICYSDYKTLVVRQELPEDSQQDLSEDSIYSGESLYKNLAFDEYQNDAENEKCLAFWRSVMEKNLQPIECTLLKPMPPLSGSKRESSEPSDTKQAVRKILKNNTNSNSSTSSSGKRTPPPSTLGTGPISDDTFQRIFNEIKKKKFNEVKLIVKQNCKTCNLINSMDNDKILSGDEKTSRQHDLNQLKTKAESEDLRGIGASSHSVSIKISEKETKQKEEKTPSQATKPSISQITTENMKQKLLEISAGTSRDHPDGVIKQDAQTNTSEHHTRHPTCTCQSDPCECKYELAAVLRSMGKGPCCCGLAQCTCRKDLHVPNDVRNDDIMKGTSEEPMDKVQSQHSQKVNTIVSNEQRMINRDSVGQKNMNSMKSITSSNLSFKTKPNESTPKSQIQQNAYVESSQNNSPSGTEAECLCKDRTKYGSSAIIAETKPTKPGERKMKQPQKDSSNSSPHCRTNSCTFVNEVENRSFSDFTSKDDSTDSVRDEQTKSGSRKIKEQISQNASVGSKSPTKINSANVSKTSDQLLPITEDSATESSKFTKKAISSNMSSSDLDKKSSSIRFTDENNASSLLGESLKCQCGNQLCTCAEKTSKSKERLSQSLTDVSFTTFTSGDKCSCGFLDCDCEFIQVKQQRKKRRPCICGCGHGLCKCIASKSISNTIKQIENKFATKLRAANLNSSSIIKTPTECKLSFHENESVDIKTVTNKKSEEKLEATKVVCDCGFSDCDCNGIPSRTTSYNKLTAVQEKLKEAETEYIENTPKEQTFTSTGIQCTNIETVKVRSRKYCYICGHYDCPCEMRKLTT